MHTSKNDNQKNGSEQKPRLRSRRVAVSLQTEQRRLSKALFSDLCPIFLDTNILIWSFGLNERASAAWQKWLFWLGKRLVIPAWVVHEYNQHIGQPEVVAPYKALSRKFQVVLDEVNESAARALDDEAAQKLGCANKVELEFKLNEALVFSLRVVKEVSSSDSGHRIDLLKFYERLLDECTHPANVHELALQANQEFNARATLRLSPGHEDADKPENQCGDLIIWKEVLQHCADMGQKQALFVTNDVKRDWCYVPLKLVRDGMKEISWSKEAAQDLRLPNPELLAEFQKHTGGSEIIFATIEQVIDTLASTEHNPVDAENFRELAQAMRSRRNPTDQAVDWIQGSKDAYNKGLQGVASWVFSPDEVDMDAFEAWCCEQMKDTNIPLDKVNWQLVFVALYL